MTQHSNQSPDLTSLHQAVELPCDLDVDSVRPDLPAKPACYLLEAEDGRPVLLSTTANLRGAVTGRLASDELRQPSRRVDYRAVTRRVRFRCVCSSFEANLVYLENARLYYPKTYGELIKHYRAYWLTIRPDDEYPRFLIRHAPGGRGVVSFGPIRDHASAKRVLDDLVDRFDLCRYHELLLQTPNATPCAYEEMGKCPAPCDGRIPMSAYYQQLAEARDWLGRPALEIAGDLKRRMKEAADAKAFEVAVEIKNQLENLKSRLSPAALKVGALADFNYLVIQKGNRKGSARCYFVRSGVLEPLGQLQPERLALQIPYLLKQIEHFPEPGTLDSSEGSPADGERVNLAAWHLLLENEGKRGVFHPLSLSLDEEMITGYIEQLWSKAVSDIGPEVDDAQDSESDSN